MLGVSHAVEVLVLGLRVMVKDSLQQLYFYTTGCSWLCHTGIYSCFFPDVVDIGSEYFVVHLSCLDYRYIYVRLIMPSYLFFCIFFNAWYITWRPKWEEALEFTYRVIGEVLVLGLLVVVYKISYSSCMWTRQDVIGVFCDGQPDELPGHHCWGAPQKHWPQIQLTSFSTLINRSAPFSTEGHHPRIPGNQSQHECRHILRNPTVTNSTDRRISSQHPQSVLDE